jgi:hypothetical protein
MQQNLGKRKTFGQPRQLLDIIHSTQQNLGNCCAVQHSSKPKEPWHLERHIRSAYEII